jgi:hypothetical protein
MPSVSCSAYATTRSGLSSTPPGQQLRATCRLHPTCITYRLLSYHTLIYRHPLYTGLCRREDLDSTSSWVFALLCKSTGPFPPHRSLPTLLLSIYPHSTRPYLCPPPPQLCLIPPQPPQNHPPLFHGSLGLGWASSHDASFLSRPKSGSVAGCSVTLGDPHPTFLTHPQKATDKVGKTNSPLSVPPTFYNPTPLISLHPLSPISPSPCRLPAHTRGGSVCGRGGVCCRFGGGQVLVELTLTLTNLGHPQQSPPLLFVDNECAIGLATSSVRPKKSKSIDMRLDWIKESVGRSELFPSCLPSWHYQPRRLLH